MALFLSCLFATAPAQGATLQALTLDTSGSHAPARPMALAAVEQVFLQVISNQAKASESAAGQDESAKPAQAAKQDPGSGQWPAILALALLLAILLLLLALSVRRSRRADRALLESQVRLQTLVDSLSDAMVAITPDRRLAACNQAFVKMMGYQPEDVLGRSTLPFHSSQETYERFAQVVYQTIQESGRWQGEWEIVREDGTLLPVELTMTEQRMPDGSLLGFVSVVKDLSGLKRAEKELRETNQRFRDTFEQAAVGMSILSPEGKWLQVNQRLCDILGYTREELLKLTYLDVTHPDQLERDAERLHLMVTGASDRSTWEKQYIRKDGQVIWVRLTIALGRSEEGKPKYLIAVTEDITQRKKAEDELAQSEEKLRGIFDTVQSGIHLVDDSGKFIFANQRMAQMFGCSLDELLGSSYLDYTHGSQSAAAEENMRALIRGEREHTSLERLYKRKDGSTFWGHISGTRLHHPDGSFLALVGVINDITKWKMAEQELRSSQDLLNEVGDIAKIGGWEMDMITRKAKWTKGTYNMIEIDPGQPIPGPDEHIEYYLPQHRPVVEEAMRALVEDQKPMEFEAQVRTTKGNITWVRAQGRAIEQDGKVVRLVGLIQDITEQKRAKEEKDKLEFQLRQAQKMEAIGTLAGGIAHDFNNILAAVLGYAEVALEGTRHGKVNPDDLEQIIRSALRAKELIKQILAFSRKNEPDLIPINLNQVVKRIAAILERTLPKMIKISYNLADNLALIQADPTQMEQVILNLGSNAQDAMPEGGKLIFETRQVILDEDYCRQHLEVRPGPYVLLEVTDNGLGMDKYTQEHIFEPFFTTKGIGKGTGLGLSSAYGIVKTHDGHLRCYSELGAGTIFKIFLPVFQGEQASVKQDFVTANEDLGGNETILLVDDEEVLRTIGTLTLQKKGYQVLTASSGEEALEIYRAQGSELQLVIMDLGMPGMGGHKALTEILATNPQAKVIIASGYSANGQVKDSLESGAAGYVAKPFRQADLLATVRQVLDKK